MAEEQDIPQTPSRRLPAAVIPVELDTQAADLQLDALEARLDRIMERFKSIQVPGDGSGPDEEPDRPRWSESGPALTAPASGITATPVAAPEASELMRIGEDVREGVEILREIRAILAEGGE